MPATRRGPHPVWFSILILPYGMAFGFVAFALPVLATRRGVPESVMGDVIALTFLVHTFKPIWAPLVDTLLTRKHWYVIALALTIAGVVTAASMPITPDHMTPLTVVVMGSQLGLTLMCMACEGFLALAIPDDEKGRASGWYNAAQFAASGLGGWAALKLAGAVPEPWMAGAGLGVAMLPCALPLLVIKLPPHEHDARLGAAMKQLGRDLWHLLTNRFGWTGMLIALLPVGSGAVSNLFNAVAPRWGIDAAYHMQLFSWDLNADDVIGLGSGLLGAALATAGAMVGGFLADRLPRRINYGIAGTFNAICAVAMALAPKTPVMFVVFSVAYNFFTGVAFAAFTSFVLETIGRGAVATKYNIFAGLANLAISYMTALDGRGLNRWGASGMLLTDAVLTLAGVGVLLVLVLAFGALRPTAPSGGE